MAALLMMMIFSAIASQATGGSVVAVEIEHLLTYIEQSGCTVYRNGTPHSAKEARAHLEKKYRYLNESELRVTTEDFIDRVASTSSTTGKPYQVKCNGHGPISSAEWLTVELKRLRSDGAAIR